MEARVSHRAFASFLFSGRELTLMNRVLGLTVLRDKLYCLSDKILDGAESLSGYFFIENVFYNDSRSSTAIDYSE